MTNPNQSLIKFFDMASYVLILLAIILPPLFIAIKVILSKKVFYRLSMLDVPLLAFLLIALVSSLFSVNLYDSFLGRSENFVLNFVFLFFSVLFYFVIVNTLHNPERWRGVFD